LVVPAGLSDGPTCPPSAGVPAWGIVD